MQNDCHRLYPRDWLFKLVRPICIILITAGIYFGDTDTQAELIETDLTSHHIVVDINFSGASITLFGTTVDKLGAVRPSKPDVVIVVEGPAQTIHLQKKSRIAGIWVNSEKQTFENSPAYLALLSNRPLAQIASSKLLLKLGIGFDSLSQELVGQNLESANINNRAFSQNLIRLMQKESKFRLDDRGVKFVGEHLFRANFTIPADVPTGNYLAKIYLFQGGTLEGVANSIFNVQKAGIEKLVYTTAHEMPFLYGVLSVIMAIAAGLGASYIFRNR